MAQDVMIALRVDPDLAERIDALRDDRSRAQWCRKAVLKVVEQSERDGSLPNSRGGRTAPPITAPPVASGPRAPADRPTYLKGAKP